MQRAASGVASLALRRLITAAAAPRPALLAAAANAASPRHALPALLQTPVAASSVAALYLYAQRGYAARAGPGRKAKAVSEDEEDEEDEDDEELAATDYDEQELEDFDDDDEVSGSDDDDKPAQKRGGR